MMRILRCIFLSLCHELLREVLTYRPSLVPFIVRLLSDKLAVNEARGQFALQTATLVSRLEGSHQARVALVR